MSNDIPSLRENTAKLLASFREHGVPVVGFVNEGKVVVGGETPADAEARTAVLKMWLDVGLELGAGRKRSPSPDPPEWVMKACEALLR